MVKTLIVGLGTQGKKRAKLIKKKLVSTVDPINKSANYKDIKDVPLQDYEAVFLCVPDNEKKKLINFCLKNKKHILVEKPLMLSNIREYLKIQTIARKNKTFLYTAFNHLYEPHLIRLKNYLEQKKIGQIYSMRIFYGNGTARLVKNSIWRDKGYGVLQDLLPHLLITLKDCIKKNDFKFRVVNCNKFENQSPDHVTLIHVEKKFRVELEMTLCSWRNTFNLDVIGEKGSIHINRLCKWGPSEFYYRKRKLPSGLPNEKKFIIRKKDPTWQLEHKFFYKSIKKNNLTCLENDILFFKTMKKIFK